MPYKKNFDFITHDSYELIKKQGLQNYKLKRSVLRQGRQLILTIMVVACNLESLCTLHRLMQNLLDDN